MGILLGLLSALGLVITIIWRIHMAADAVREVAGAANNTKLWFRRAKWRRKVNRDLFKMIEDPREAASIMMAAIAETDGAMTEQEQNMILSILQDKFQVSEEVAKEYLAHGCWMARDAGDLTSFLKRLTPAVNKNCTDQEKVELLAMLGAVAATKGEIPAEQQQSLRKLKEYLVV